MPAKTKGQFDTKFNKPKQLINQCDELQKMELMKAIEDSDRSFEEIMQLL